MTEIYRVGIILEWTTQAFQVFHLLANFIVTNMVLDHHSSLWQNVTILERSHRGYSRSGASQFIVAEAYSFLKTHISRILKTVITVTRIDHAAVV